MIIDELSEPLNVLYVDQVDILLCSHLYYKIGLTISGNPLLPEIVFFIHLQRPSQTQLTKIEQYWHHIIR